MESGVVILIGRLIGNILAWIEMNRIKAITAREIIEGIEATAQSFSPDAKEFITRWLKGGGLDIQEGDELLTLLSESVKSELWESISVVEDDTLLYRGDNLDPKVVLEIQRDYNISDFYDRSPSALYEVWTKDRNFAIDLASKNSSGLVFSTYVPKDDIVVAARDVDWLFNPHFLLDDRFLVKSNDRRCEIEEILFLTGLT